jgi:small neutral amino acid transporter SnatA (MarC family)
VLNLLAMVSAHTFAHGALAMGVRALGAVLGVLQVALGVEFVIRGLQALEIMR